MVNRLRTALSDKSVRAATVLSSWADTDGLIPKQEIIEVFKQKNKRNKAAAATKALATEKTITIDVDSE